MATAVTKSAPLIQCWTGCYLATYINSRFKYKGKKPREFLNNAQFGG